LGLFLKQWKFSCHGTWGFEATWKKVTGGGPSKEKLETQKNKTPTFGKGNANGSSETCLTLCGQIGAGAALAEQRKLAPGRRGQDGKDQGQGVNSPTAGYREGPPFDTSKAKKSG